MFMKRISWNELSATQLIAVIVTVTVMVSMYLAFIIIAFMGAWKWGGFLACVALVTVGLSFEINGSRYAIIPDARVQNAIWMVAAFSAFIMYFA